MSYKPEVSHMFCDGQQLRKSFTMQLLFLLFTITITIYYLQFTITITYFQKISRASAKTGGEHLRDLNTWCTNVTIHLHSTEFRYK